MTLSSFIGDAEHLPPLEEGAAEERPDRLVVAVVEPFIPLLMDEVVFLADGMLMSKVPLTSNFGTNITPRFTPFPLHFPFHFTSPCLL